MEDFFKSAGRIFWIILVGFITLLMISLFIKKFSEIDLETGLTIKDDDLFLSYKQNEFELKLQSFINIVDEYPLLTDFIYFGTVDELIDEFKPYLKDNQFYGRLKKRIEMFGYGDIKLNEGPFKKHDLELLVSGIPDGKVSTFSLNDEDLKTIQEEYIMLYLIYTLRSGLMIENNFIQYPRAESNYIAMCMFERTCIKEKLDEYYEDKYEKFGRSIMFEDIIAPNAIQTFEEIMKEKKMKEIFQGAEEIIGLSYLEELEDIALGIKTKKYNFNNDVYKKTKEIVDKSKNRMLNIEKEVDLKKRVTYKMSEKKQLMSSLTNLFGKSYGIFGI